MKRIFALLFIVMLVPVSAFAMTDEERDKAIDALFMQADISIKAFSKNLDRNELLKAAECTDKALQLAWEPVSEAIEQMAKNSKTMSESTMYYSNRVVNTTYAICQLQRQKGCLRYKGIANMFAIVGDKEKARNIYRFIIENFDKKDYHQCATSAEFGLEDADSGTLEHLIQSIRTVVLHSEAGHMTS